MGFEALRGFVVQELSVSTSDYAQAFFGLDDKGKSQDSGCGGCKTNPVRVRQVVLSDEPRPGLTKRSKDRLTNLGYSNFKFPLFCFVCDNNKSRHFLADCEKFKSLNPHQKCKTVVDANRCFSCLSQGHIARECKQHSKCCLCGPGYAEKHTVALHDWFVLSSFASVGGARSDGQISVPGFSHIGDRDSLNDNMQKIKVLKISNQGDDSRKVVLLRTSAVTGKSTLAYAQSDTA